MKLPFIYIILRWILIFGPQVGPSLLKAYNLFRWFGSLLIVIILFSFLISCNHVSVTFVAISWVEYVKCAG